MATSRVPPRGRPHVVHVVEERQRDVADALEDGHGVDHHLGLGADVQPVADERAGLEQDGRVLGRDSLRRRDVLDDGFATARVQCRARG